MGTPQATYGATDRRETVFYFKPQDIVIVGLDVPDGDSVLSDPDRVAMGFDEGMVQSIMAQGINTPVTIRKNGNKPNGDPNTELVAGRGRVMACREAWKRLAKAGVAEADMPLVPAIRTRGEQADVMAIMLAENMVRRAETPLSIARKAKRFYTVTRDKARTALVCGVTTQTVESWLRLLELAPAVQTMIETGKVSATAALTVLKDVPVEDQGKRLLELMAEGKVQGLAAQVEARRTRADAPPVDRGAKNGHARPDDGEDDAPVVPTKRAIRRFRQEFTMRFAKTETFTAAQVAQILDLVLDGQPLRGPLRQAWASSQKPAKPAPREG